MPEGLDSVNPLLLFHRFVSALAARWNRLCASACLARLKRSGKGIHLGRGILINHPECVVIGDDVFIHEHCWISILAINRETGAPDLPLTPELSIGERTYIGRFATFACMDNITIGRDIMISDRVYIGDCLHGFRRGDLPIKDQYMHSPGPVVIGDGTWIGIGAAILPNVKIGRNCVIGANSVVTHDVPDGHVVAGSPARELGISAK
jgi:acetyltransferase-like isoleucine patch superfamily enzyme